MVTGPTLSGITVRSALDKAERVAGYAGFRAEQAAARAEGRYLGLGVAAFIEAAPGPPDYGPAIGFAVPPERATARLEADGTLTVHTSQAPHGQSHETTLAQVAADTLGVPMASVRVVHGDSRTSPFSMMGTGGSRAATVATGAVLGVTREIRSQVAAIAAHLFEANPDDIDVVDGVAQVRGTPSVAMPLAQVAMTAWMAPQFLPPGASPGIEATFDFSSGAGGWTQSVHSCFVEVDVETGFVKILRYVVVEDCGDVINPAIVEGQIRGGIAQGIAGVLYEHAAYDDHAQLPGRDVHGLPAPDRVRDPGDRDPPRRPDRPYRRGQLPRRRRGRRDRRAGRGDERHRGRAAPVRREDHRAVPATGEDPRARRRHPRELTHPVDPYRRAFSNNARTGNFPGAPRGTFPYRMAMANPTPKALQDAAASLRSQATAARQAVEEQSRRRDGENQTALSKAGERQEAAQVSLKAAQSRADDAFNAENAYRTQAHQLQQDARTAAQEGDAAKANDLNRQAANAAARSDEAAARECAGRSARSPTRPSRWPRARRRWRKPPGSSDRA